MSRRKLAPDELELWKKVAERTERMSRSRVIDTEISTATRKPKSPVPAEWLRPDAKPASSPSPRKVAFDLVPDLPDRLHKAPVQMDKKTHTRMARGKLRPDARIDLHGMTLDRAHAALGRFILSAHGSGKRLVLVITGKGKDRDEGGPIPVRHGVLRHQVPHWLGTQPLASVVLQISSAHISHGGGGAYYVYLRRQR